MYKMFSQKFLTIDERLSKQNYFQKDMSAILS